MRFPLMLLLLVACAGRDNLLNCATEDCESCEVLKARLGWPDGGYEIQKCLECQGMPSTPEIAACSNFPSEAGVYVVRGCNEDADCLGLSRFCGQYTGQPHNVCVLQDAK